MQTASIWPILSPIARHLSRQFPTFLHSVDTRACNQRPGREMTSEMTSEEGVLAANAEVKRETLSCIFQIPTHSEPISRPRLGLE